MTIYQLLLNSETGGFRFYGSINAMDSVKLLYVIFWTITRWQYPRWRYPNWRTFVVLHPCSTLYPQLHLITVLEDNRDTFRFTTRQPLRINCPGGRRLPKLTNVLL